ncbi:unnamed protein product [Ilex paraguariensis]|uniref:HXXXD-type acyl-transferase family protein n=1 Tax=Ilex paraguariensis TaxID=185542 RepID=A0ABC8SQG2_9AQUA
MEEVRVVSTCTIRPARSEDRDDSTQRMELTPWDLQLLAVGPIQKGLLLPKPQPQNEKELTEDMSLIDHLKASLSRTLDYFPPLAGRLAVTKHTDNTTSFFIDCNDAGVQFTHAAANDLTVSDILKPLYVPGIVHSFFPMNGVLNHEGVTNPLVAVQVTELIDGFFIGCTMNHSVADGTSFWLFFNSWSEISRGLNRHLSKPPVLERWFPDGINFPIPTPFCDEKLVDTFVRTPTQDRVFHFSKQIVGKLKAQANAEMGTDRISSLQALLAHVWRSVIRCRNVAGDREAIFIFLIGARQRLFPPLPEGYFGNAVHSGLVATTAGELIEQGLGGAALQMNKMIALQTHEEVMNFYENWVKNPRLVKMGTMLNTSLATSSSPRYNVYGNDFGWGKPLAVRSGGANKSDGKITIFPGVEEGSIDIEVCLLSETLRALGDDSEFMEAVTI